MYVCDALRDFLSFEQFKKREKHPWRSVTFSKVGVVCSFTKSNTPPWVFFTFLKLYKWYQFAQRITFVGCDTFKHWWDYALKWTKEVMKFEIFVQSGKTQDTEKCISKLDLL